MTPPKVIYLQWYDEEDGKELDATNEEVTWCVDRINPRDVRYILDPNVADVEEYYPEESE